MSEILSSSSEAKKFRILRKMGKITLRVMIATAVLYPAADYYGAKLRWHENDTYATMVRDNPEQDNSDALLVLPGFGNKDGIKIADSIAPGIPENYMIGTINYSDEAAVDMGQGGDAGKELADKIREFADKEDIEELSLYLHSMATSIFLQTLPHLQGVPIDTIVMDCSPYDDTTVFEQDTVEKGADTWYPFGILSKTIYEMYESTNGPNKNNDLSFREQLSDGVRISVTGSSPFLAKSNAEVLVDTDPAAFIEYFKSIRRIVYLIPENPDNDHTVMINTALAKWQTLLGSKLEIVRIPKGGHADPMYRTEEYQTAMKYVFPEPTPLPPIAPKLAVLLENT
jgi:hypothetical protein